MRAGPRERRRAMDQRPPFPVTGSGSPDEKAEAVTTPHHTTDDVTHVDLYDTTLRDGTQQEGISLSVADKLRVASVLDTLGVNFIEGGWPGANPKDTEFFKRAASGELELKRATLTAFGMTRRANVDASGDPGLLGLLEAQTPVVCLVGKTDLLHVTEALGTDREEAVRMVADSVAFLRGEGKRVFFDAEHFFDGHTRDASFALDVVTAAAEAGAECVVLCDTNGGALPDDVDRVVREVMGRVGSRAQLGIHVHNDADCAVANSLVAVRAGVTHVQGTANGIGERCGNANLMSLIPNLKLKLGLDVVAEDDLRRLTTAAHELAEVMNLTLSPHAPYVGSAAFAHKAGLHVSALAKNTDLYQHVQPESVGNSLRLLVSELAGRSTVLLKGKDLGVDLSADGEAITRILDRVKELEHIGYTFEAADASFELLVRTETGEQTEFFRLESFRTIVTRDDTGQVKSEAIIKLWVGDERRTAVGEGNGPVSALDDAFRTAMNGRFPSLHAMHLADYKVRIVDPASGTGASTRVLVTSTDGEREWETVGVSANIIDASWKAMQDAYNYAMLHGKDT